MVTSGAILQVTFHTGEHDANVLDDLSNLVSRSVGYQCSSKTSTSLYVVEYGPLLSRSLP